MFVKIQKQSYATGCNTIITVIVNVNFFNSTLHLHITDMMSLKRMMEKLGVPKTHLQIKKMISEVTGGVSDTINYRDFVKMMLGKRSAVLKL